jgi:transposase InsO family protein
MAPRTVVQLVDDLDGTHIPDNQGETVTFGLDGATYENDLRAENAGSCARRCSSTSPTAGGLAVAATARRAQARGRDQTSSRRPLDGYRSVNAVIESFWSRMPVELLNRHRWRTRVELANAIFEYLEIFHNRQRRHTALGYLGPAEY